MAPEESLIEMDRGPRRIVDDVTDGGIELDLTDGNKSEARCIVCKALAPINERGECRICYEGVARPDVPTTGLGAALGNIASQASADANAFNTNAVANGRASLGVGFSNAEGYIESLRRGVSFATMREYVRTLQRTYKRKVTSETNASASGYTITIDGESFTASALIAAPSGAPASDVDSHANDEFVASMKAKREAKKNAKAKAKAEENKPATVVPSEEETKVHLVHGQLVAGAAAEGHGILVGWTGAGDMTRAQMGERIDAAGVPREWMWDAKDPGVQLTRAVRAASGNEYNCEQEKKKESQVAEAREWSSRWMLVSRSVTANEGGTRVGQTFGNVALCVTLYTDKPDPELVFDEGADEELIERVRAEFTSRIGEQRYVASDVSRWIKETLRKRLDAARYGGNWYVPRIHRATAERLVDAFKNWGSDWMDPPLPIASSDQLAKGLANGFKRDVDDILGTLEAQRKERRKNDPEAEIGEVAAQSFITKLRGVLERCHHYSVLLGDDCVNDVRERVRVAMTELSAALDESTLAINARFSNIWDEVKRDIKAGEES
jgi:hypothetical protein